jgi:hypothetical protein
MSIGQIAAQTQGYAVAANWKISGSLLDIRGGTSQAQIQAGQDGVDISTAARELANRLRELDAFSVIHPNSDPRRATKTLDEVKSDFLNDFASFAGAFGNLPSLTGRDSGQTFILRLDGVGGLAVDGGDGSAIAEKLGGLFNDDRLTSRFAVMAARAALVDAGETLDGFRNDYAADPFAAIKDNIDALKERLLGFRARIADDGVDYGFRRGFELEIGYSAVSLSHGTASTGEAAEMAAVA